MDTQPICDAFMEALGEHDEGNIYLSDYGYDSATIDGKFKKSAVEKMMHAKLIKLGWAPPAQKEQQG